MHRAPLKRRQFLSTTAGLAGCAAASMLAGCEGAKPWDRFTSSVDFAGMAQGHVLRDRLKSNPGLHLNQSPTHRVKTCIVGSGIAGLSASWTLHEAGDHDQLMLSGPELHGNAASFILGGKPCPTGAHYLPLPSFESTHVRHILSRMGVLQSGANSARPLYDESVVVHSPADRLLRNHQWEAGLQSAALLDQNSMAQQGRFTQLINQYASTKGRDGRRVFVVPISLASTDPQWLALDSLTFAQWLAQTNFTATSLLWYLDYCCRDEFGAGSPDVSAWAGLHYFCSRSGHASNAEDGAVLTWADGLNPIAKFLESPARQRQQILSASAVFLQRSRAGQKPFVDIHAHYMDARGQSQPVLVRAQRVIMATPLFIAARIDPEIQLSFNNFEQLLPRDRSWLMGNFQFARPLPERDGQGLSWDNLIYQSKGLGYVNADHQALRVDQSLGPILTTYHALADQTGAQARRWLSQASKDRLLTLAAQDLIAAYGDRFWQHLIHAHLTVRGHAMACPEPGFLSNSLVGQLREETGTVLYAHADLSGYSVFEEAAWWGVRAGQLA